MHASWRSDWDCDSATASATVHIHDQPISHVACVHVPHALLRLRAPASALRPPCRVPAAAYIVETFASRQRRRLTRPPDVHTRLQSVCVSLPCPLHANVPLATPCGLLITRTRTHTNTHASAHRVLLHSLLHFRPQPLPLRLRGGSSTVFTSCKVFALSSRSVHAAIHTLRRHRPSTQASTDRSQPEPQPEPHPHPTTRHNPLDLNPFSTRPRHKLGTSSARPRLDLDSISARPAASTGVRRAARRPWRCLGWPHAWWPHAW